MTHSRQHTARHPDPANVIGPYSLWPRQPRKQKNWKTPTILVTTAASAAVFVHCVLPAMT